jgi:hypothetical protein
VDPHHAVLRKYFDFHLCSSGSPVTIYLPTSSSTLPISHLSQHPPLRVYAFTSCSRKLKILRDLERISVREGRKTSRFMLSYLARRTAWSIVGVKKRRTRNKNWRISPLWTSVCAATGVHGVLWIRLGLDCIGERGLGRLNYGDTRISNTN